MKYFEEKEGNIFFIPLFLPLDMKDNNKSYSNFKFNENEDYAFGRLIRIDKSSGNLIEIFKYRGKIPSDKNVITESGLMFEPIHIAMAFSKNRWRFIFETDNYKKEENSNYNDIGFLLGDKDSPILWKGGVESNPNDQDLLKYKEWIVHHPTRIEKGIKENDFSIIF